MNTVKMTVFFKGWDCFFHFPNVEIRLAEFTLK
jgi:hypothetical protein